MSVQIVSLCCWWSGGNQGQRPLLEARYRCKVQGSSVKHPIVQRLQWPFYCLYCMKAAIFLSLPLNTSIWKPPFLTACVYLSLPVSFALIHTACAWEGTSAPCITLLIRKGQLDSVLVWLSHCQEKLNFQNITAVCPMGLQLTQSYSHVHTHKPFFFFFFADTGCSQGCDGH